MTRLRFYLESLMPCQKCGDVFCSRDEPLVIALPGDWCVVVSGDYCSTCEAAISAEVRRIFAASSSSSVAPSAQPPLGGPGGA